MGWEGVSASHPANSEPLQSAYGRDAVAHGLLEILKGREAEQKREAQAALEEFDRKQWRQWAKSLPQRASRIRPGSALFKHLALERWAAFRGIGREQVMAVGDNHNDVEMLEFAGHPVIMGNACAELRGRGWTVTLSNGECGVAEAV